ncbi:MAG: DUF2784 domain-containing protein [Gemmatimonadaceae bacterium]|nr:DUF2784 domain-containing protein [Gemmatimonadaceae bacterium]
MLARAVATAHGLFAVFAVFGGFLIARLPWVIWPHVAAVLWTLGTLALDWGCPLTPLEKSLRSRAGAPSFDVGFVQHYIMRTDYTRTAARRLHVLLAIVVFTFNIFVYLRLFRPI